MLRAFIVILVLVAAAASAGVEVWQANDVPIRERLRLLFGEAEDELAVAADRFTDYSLADALILAASRGRRVRVVLDGDRRNLLVGKALGDHLAAGGVEVYYDRGEANLYDRFVVVDERLVVVGSYPFIEEAAASPMADVVVIDDAEVARKYLDYFDFLVNVAK